MSEGIWVYVFMIFCGFWFAVILIGIGVMIGGRIDKKQHNNNPDMQLCISNGPRNRGSDN